MFNGKKLPLQRNLSTFLHCSSDLFPSFYATTSPSHTDVHHPEKFISIWLFLCPYSPSLQPDSAPSASSLASFRWKPFLMVPGTFLDWFRLQLGTQPIAGRILAPGYFLICKELLEATLSLQEQCSAGLQLSAAFRSV